jgi:type I restriction enzyme S subunit
MRDGWVETSFGDIFKIVAGKYVAKEEYVEGGEFWIYGSNSIMGKLDRFLVEQSHVVMAAIGAYAGAVRYSKEPSWINNNAMALVPSEKVIAKYLHLWLESKFDLKRVVVGTGQPYVQRPLLLKEIIALPPLSEQKRIVDLISSVDSYLGSLKTTLAKSISARKSALESQLDSFIKTSPILRLEELCATGKSAIVDGPFGANLKREDYLEEGVPVLKIQNIKQDYIVIKKMDFVSEAKYQELRRHSFQNGDIIMTKLGDPLGLSAIVREIDKGLIVADLVRIRPEKIDVEFLCMQLNSAKIQNYINRMQKGSTRPRVNLGMIREMPIAVPSDSEIHDFVRVFGAWSQQNKKLEETIQSAEKLRSGLLSELLSGEHEIPTSYDKVMGAA